MWIEFHFQKSDPLPDRISDPLPGNRRQLVQVAVKMALKGKCLIVYSYFRRFLADPCGSLYKLADMAACPDVYHTQEYEAEHRAKGTPVVIDNGELWHVTRAVC